MLTDCSSKRDRRFSCIMKSTSTRKLSGSNTIASCLNILVLYHLWYRSMNVVALTVLCSVLSEVGCCRKHLSLTISLWIFSWFCGSWRFISFKPAFTEIHQITQFGNRFFFIWKTDWKLLLPACCFCLILWLCQCVSPILLLLHRTAYFLLFLLLNILLLSCPVSPCSIYVYKLLVVVTCTGS